MNNTYIIIKKIQLNFIKLFVTDYVLATLEYKFYWKILNFTHKIRLKKKLQNLNEVLLNITSVCLLLNSLIMDRTIVCTSTKRNRWAL